MRHRFTAPLALAAVLTLAACGSDGDEPTVAAPTTSAPTGSAEPSPTPTEQAPVEVAGLITYASTGDVPQTVTRVQDALKQNGMVTATVDHAAAAESVDLDLRPTTVVIGGSAELGTPLMQAAQPIAADLPLKFLAWEGEDGQTFLSYNSVDHLAARAGLDPADPALDAPRMASKMLAEAGSGSTEPVSTGEGSTARPEDYLVQQEATGTVAEAISRYEAAFEENGLMVPATVDHSQGAAAAGLMLRPTQTIFAGNPMVGTPLMQAAQTFGIDLPVRYVAYEDEAGVVRVGHPSIQVLAERHGLDGEPEEVLSMIEAATAMFDDLAAGG